MRGLNSFLGGGGAMCRRPKIICGHDAPLSMSCRALRSACVCPLSGLHVQAFDTSPRLKFVVSTPRARASATPMAKRLAVPDGTPRKQSKAPEEPAPASHEPVHPGLEFLHSDILSVLEPELERLE